MDIWEVVSTRRRLVVIATAVVALSGCHAATASSPFEGNWSSAMLGVWVKFNPDHSFSQGPEAGAAEQLGGTWASAGSVASVHLTKSNGRPVPTSMAHLAIKFNLSPDGKTLSENNGTGQVEFTRDSK